jgi:hypothetical protein
MAHESNETRQNLIQATSDLMDLHVIEKIIARSTISRTI